MGKKGKILIVDDRSDWRSLIQEILDDEGYNLVFASNFQEAIAAIDKSNFDAAIVDVRLDDDDRYNVDGLKLLRKIKTKMPSTGVMILTGYAGSVNQEIILQYEADEFYEKVPSRGKFEIDDFLKRIEQLISTNRRARILLVDDRSDWLEVIRELLIELYDVTVAKSYKLAEKLINEEEFDAAVLDIRLDDTDPYNVDGLKLLKMIKENKSDVRVMVLTGYFKKDVKLQHDADVLYHKVPETGSFDIDDFCNAVSSLIKK